VGKPTFLGALRQLAPVDLRWRLSQVAVPPTLVLCGAKDRGNIPLSRELAAGIATASTDRPRRQRQPERAGRPVARPFSNF
jgi:hypothetical protein